MNTKGTKIYKVLQLHNWELPIMASFPIIFYFVLKNIWLA